MNATMIGVPVLSRFAGSVVLRALALMRALDLEAVMCVCVCVCVEGSVGAEREGKSRMLSCKPHVLQQLLVVDMCESIRSRC
jgi:hypothetical protein